MKLLALCAAALLCVSAVADGESPFLTGGALDAEVAKNCSQGCIVFSPAEAQALMDAINAKLQERELAAFEAGRAAMREVCRNSI